MLAGEREYDLEGELYQQWEQTHKAAWTAACGESGSLALVGAKGRARRRAAVKAQKAAPGKAKGKAKS